MVMRFQSPLVYKTKWKEESVNTVNLEIFAILFSRIALKDTFDKRNFARVLFSRKAKFRGNCTLAKTSEMFI